MGGFFGVAAKEDCVFDLFFGTDYHSHLGTRRAGMAVYSKEEGYNRAMHRSVRSSTRMSMRCTDIWASAVFPILSPSR